MKKSVVFLSIFFISINANSQLQITAPGVKWDESYSFDKCNVFKMEMYAKNNELMRTVQCKTYYQSSSDNFDVRFNVENKGSGMETVIDKKNEVAIQIFAPGSPTPYYNTGKFKYPAENELKKLEILPASDTKVIAGYTCKKYTYTYKKIFGEVWVADKVLLSNDLGVFRACKMAAIHNSLSVKGFVMEMTTEDARGGKTIMTTVSLKNEEKYTLNLKGVEMNTAINKVNYYTF